MNIIREEEQKHLEHTKECIVKEKEKCEKELKEIPKRYTKALQGDAFLVEGLMTIEATRLRRLGLAEDNPYFGRIDFLSDGSNEVTKIYVGKTNISNEYGEQITTDWRAPICSIYYDSNLGEVYYEAPIGIIKGELKLKRQIIIKDGELIDVLNTDLVNNDELLQPYLSVNADNKMKTIIASIQKEQNKIIRMPFNKNIIVQGVAGSGKTSVALHRIAYLVYNINEKVKSNQFLVIGPNKYFLDYISSILPELYTEPVEQNTYFDLVLKEIREKLTLINETDTFNLKNNPNISRKVQNYKSSLRYKNAISKFIEYYINNGIVTEGFYIDNEEIFSKEEVRARLFSSNASHPNFNNTCEYFLERFKDNINDIYNDLNAKYRKVYINLPKGNPTREEAIKKSNELYKTIKTDGIKLLKKYFKKINLSSTQIYKLFIENINLYDDTLSEEEIQEIRSTTIPALNKKKVSFEDLPALMHIDDLLNGTNNQYKHIVIDEAQDYGLFHFSILKDKYPNCTFSIYGDLAQSIYSYRSIEDWESVVREIFGDNCEILNLSKSYRTTIEITNNANKILDKMNLNIANPVIRHGEDISFNRDSVSNHYECLLNKIYNFLEKGYKTIAIICKTDKEAALINEKLQSLGLDNKLITSKETNYKGGIFVITSALSKGLEFDAVIINDASNNVYNSESLTDMHLLYVACTRALHELDILYKNQLCEVLDYSDKKTNVRTLRK